MPIADDWNVFPLAASAIHHHLTLSQLWGPYGDTRLFVGYVFFAAFALFDHLNEKSIILFSATTLIASFVLLLVMFRSYLRRRLTFLPVFSFGIVAAILASLAEVQGFVVWPVGLICLL